MAYVPPILGAVGRVVDLRDIFSEFLYYDSKQQGFTSIKKVLPTVTGTDYSDMDIADGTTASVEFMKVMGLYKEKPQDIEKVRKALLEYCKLDTWAEVLILKEMEKF